MVRSRIQLGFEASPRLSMTELPGWPLLFQARIELDEKYYLPAAETALDLVQTKRDPAFARIAKLRQPTGTYFAGIVSNLPDDSS